MHRITVLYRAMPDDPRWTKCRERAQFKKDSINDLANEARLLGGRQVIVEAGYRENQIRNDGLPYSSEIPCHPAVRVYVQMRDDAIGTLSWDCDRWLAYHHNLRAVCMTIEALRGLERWGAVKKNQQFFGFKALPTQAEGVQSLARELVDLARKADGLIVRTAADVLASPEVAREVYRVAARACHPDTGGTQAAFDRLQHIKKALAI